MANAELSRTSNAVVHSTAYYLLQALNEIDIEYLFCNFGTDHAPLIEELARFHGEGLRAPEDRFVPARKCGLAHGRRLRAR